MILLVGNLTQSLPLEMRSNISGKFFGPKMCGLKVYWKSILRGKKKNVKNQISEKWYFRQAEFYLKTYYV